MPAFVERSDSKTISRDEGRLSIRAQLKTSLRSGPRSLRKKLNKLFDKWQMIYWSLIEDHLFGGAVWAVNMIQIVEFV